MDGIELTSHIRSNYGLDLPIIMISSRSMQKHRDMAWEAGINAYLTKPYTDDFLLHYMDKLLRGNSQ
jgi:CheY-like chemotaxis protein